MPVPLIIWGLAAAVGSSAFLSGCSSSPEPSNTSDHPDGGLSPDGGPSIPLVDLDGDTYPQDPSLTDPHLLQRICQDHFEDCTNPAEQLKRFWDCNDTTAAVKPGAPELCNGVNDDCNPATVDGASESWFSTQCGPETDVGECAYGTWACTTGAKTCANAVHPTAETCDSKDNNCDSVVDNILTGGNLFYPDADLDGHGATTATAIRQCSTTPPTGHVEDNIDCDDTRDYVYPNAAQRFTSFDTNCDNSMGMEITRDSTTILGSAPNENVGVAVALGNFDGDKNSVNGADYADLAVGAPAATNLAPDYASKVYIRRGGPNRFMPGASLTFPGAADTIIQFKDRDASTLGADMAAGDVNGDGKTDLMMGMTGFNKLSSFEDYQLGDGSASGAIFFFYGRSTLAPLYELNYAKASDVAVLSAMQVGVLKGGNNERIGTEQRLLGNVNGTGQRLAVGNGSSRLDLLPIPADGIQGIVNKSDLMNGTTKGIRIQLTSGGTIGDKFASGDINHDGYDDTVMGDYATGTGKIWIVYGSNNLPVWPSVITLNTLQPTSSVQYMTLVGAASLNGTGRTLDVKDIDGDGYAEIVLSEPGDNTNGTSSGKVTVLSGLEITKARNGQNPNLSIPNGAAVPLTSSNIEQLKGRQTYGESANSLYGWHSVSFESDMDGDGKFDLICGSADYAISTQGVRGRLHLFTESKLKSMPATPSSPSQATASVNGELDHKVGRNVKGGYDLNGDGVHDMAVSRSDTAANTDLRGGVHVFLGGR